VGTSVSRLWSTRLQEVSSSSEPASGIEAVVDFSKFAGKTLLLRNKGKTPYPNGATVNSKTTGQVMQIRVAAAPVAVPGWTPPATPINPDLAVYPSITQPVTKVRSLTLNEWMGVGQPLMMTRTHTKWPHDHMGHIMAPTHRVSEARDGRALGDHQHYGPIRTPSICTWSSSSSSAVRSTPCRSGTRPTSRRSAAWTRR